MSALGHSRTLRLLYSKSPSAKRVSSVVATPCHAIFGQALLKSHQCSPHVIRVRRPRAKIANPRHMLGASARRPKHRAAKKLMNSRRLMEFTPLAENHLRESPTRSSSESYEMCSHSGDVRSQHEPAPTNLVDFDPGCLDDSLPLLGILFQKPREFSRRGTLNGIRVACKLLDD